MLKQSASTPLSHMDLASLHVATDQGTLVAAAPWWLCRTLPDLWLRRMVRQPHCEISDSS